MTNYMSKVSYAAVNYPLGFPMILADKYWDYYMSLVGQTDKWNRFMNLWNEEGFETYDQFITEFNEVAKKSAMLMFNGSVDESVKKLHEYAENSKEWEFPTKIQNNLKPGKYIKVDIHSSVDYVLKEIGIFNDKYDSLMEIINGQSKYEIFKDIKLMKFRTLKFNGINNHPDIKKISRSIILKKIYESGLPEIDIFNKSCRNVFVSGNDMYLYELDNPDEFEYLCGDYITDNGISFNISMFKNMCVQIMDSQYNFSINLSKKYVDYDLRNYPKYFIPLMIRLIKGEHPTEMDLAIGYEDQIFFHLNENDYKIL